MTIDEFKDWIQALSERTAEGLTASEWAEVQARASELTAPQASDAHALSVSEQLFTREADAPWYVQRSG